jgi:protein phosphatase 1 regulatory subunit 37
MGNLLMILKGSAEIISRAHALLSRIENSVNSSRSISVASSGASSPTVVQPTSQDLDQQARAMIGEITEKLQTTTDAVLLEDLLGLCDKLNTSIARLSTIPSSKPLLHSLGLKLASSATSFADLHQSPADEEPVTPKVDKGKGRAEPEPEEPEKVLSPTFMITESEDEDEDDNRFSGEEDQASTPSPVVRWIIILEKTLHALMISKGRKVGWKKKVRSSERVPFFSDLRRWKGNTLVKTSVVR